MTDAPKRIWTWPFMRGERNKHTDGGWSATPDAQETEYIRADAAEAERDGIFLRVLEEISVMRKEALEKADGVRFQALDDARWAIRAMLPGDPFGVLSEAGAVAQPDQTAPGLASPQPGEVPASSAPAPDDSGILVGIRQQSSIDGCLIRIGRSGDSAAFQMQDMEGQVLSGFTASKTLAKEMAALIYEPMRVSGVALWNRSAEGVWEMDRMQVQSYELLDDVPATVLLDRLRGLDVKWPDDADQKLSDERGAMP